MSLPTTGVLFSGSFPPADAGNQLAIPHSDGGQPAQIVSFEPRPATSDLLGVVKPDGTTITIADDGTLSAVATLPGGGGGGTGGGGSASGGAYVCVAPTPDPADGTRTQWILPAPVLGGTDYWLNRNDTVQRQIGQKAYYSVQGTQLTLVSPLEADGYLEFHYIMGQPNSESGGGGVTPTGPATLRGSSGGASTSGSTATITFPAGTAVGDLVIVMATTANIFGVSTPSGWTPLYVDTPANWCIGIFSKVMDSSDISAGHVTVNIGGSSFNTWQAAAFIGSTPGVRETDGLGLGNSSSTPVSATSAVQAGDVALYFGSARTFGGGAVAVCTADHGLLLQQADDGSDVSSCLYGETLSAGGAYTMNFLYSNGTNSTEQAIVIVKGA